MIVGAVRERVFIQQEQREMQVSSLQSAAGRYDGFFLLSSILYRAIASWKSHGQALLAVQHCLIYWITFSHNSCVVAAAPVGVVCSVIISSVHSSATEKVECIFLCAHKRFIIPVILAIGNDMAAC